MKSMRMIVCMYQKIVAVAFSVLAVVSTSSQGALNVSIPWIPSAFTDLVYPCAIAVVMCNTVIAFSSVMLEVGQ
jgi:hypothetical protein